jgi:hypothetical protein
MTLSLKRENMTSHIDYMTDITASELYDGLMGHDYYNKFQILNLKVKVLLIPHH